MHFIRITDDAAREDLAEAALHLMRREAAESDDLIRGYITEDVDELVSMLRARDGVPA